MDGDAFLLSFLQCHFPETRHVKSTNDGSVVVTTAVNQPAPGLAWAVRHVRPNTKKVIVECKPPLHRFLEEAMIPQCKRGTIFKCFPITFVNVTGEDIGYVVERPHIEVSIDYRASTDPNLRMQRIVDAGQSRLNHVQIVPITDTWWVYTNPLKCFALAGAVGLVAGFALGWACLSCLRR